MKAGLVQRGFTLLAILALGLACGPKAFAQPVGDTDMVTTIEPERLERFWALIETSNLTADQWVRLEALRTELRNLPAEQVAEFDHVMAALHARAYRWDLWGAAYVIKGGASDDSFHYFRSWLIGKGRAVYEAALADPDSLADVFVDDDQDYAEFEELGYVAQEIWSEKSGETQIPPSPFSRSQADPTGAPFEEGEKQLASRYPKLWARFGDNPL
jgi:Protein of unknown function (DUF4240)